MNRPKRHKRAPAKPVRKKGLSWVGARGGKKGQRRRAAGVLARVTWLGKRYQKWFSAGAHGGRLGAMRQGAAWVLATERKLGKPSVDRQVVVRSPANKTGVIGVRSARRAGPQQAKLYVVDWIEIDGRRRRTSFSVARHGQAKAFALAVKLRRRKERELYGRPLPAQKRRPARKGR